MRLARSSLIRHRLFLVGSEPTAGKNWTRQIWIQFKLDHDKIIGVAVGQSTVN
jgi:hypothetical protein